MTYKEIREKAEMGNLKLEDLEIEDILKFGDEGFINVELAECFNISIEEVKKIKKKKNVSDSYYEDCIRDIIVLIDTIKEKYPNFPKEYFNTFATGYIMGLEEFRGYRVNYLNKTRDFDWQNLDTKKEIKMRKIDVEYRQERIKELLNYIEENYINNKSGYNYFNEEEFIPKKELRKEPKSNNVYTYPRDKKVSERALERSNYCCALNPEHPTFIRRTTGKRYMEPHHLIPLDFYYLFEYSLDVEANIVCLCSNCHNEIHYGKNYKQLIKKLYEKRKDELKKCGIEINNIATLYKMYDKYASKEEIKL